MVMKHAEVEVLLAPEAEREFDGIQRSAPVLVRDWAYRYLQDLVLFPPEDWVDLHERLGGDLFKSDNHVPFDIQGKILYGRDQVVERVLVTRFRLRETGSRSLG